MGILALIALWLFLMLAGASYFSRGLPEGPWPTRWNPYVVRVGMALLLGGVGLLVAERKGLEPSLQIWVGVAGAVFGLLVERGLRRFERRFPARGRRGER